MRGLGKSTVSIVAIVLTLCTPTWACHQIIRYTKAEIETANVRLYEHEVSQRARDISGFDQKHGLIGAMLGNQRVYEQELQAWKSHPGRFKREHHRLWRLLDGDMLYHKKRPYETSISQIPPGLLPPGQSGGGGPTPPNPPHGGNPGFPVHPASVPEPASGVLALTALAAGVLTAIRRMRTKVTS